MRILFVRSGNNGIDPISTRQGESLKKRNIEIIYFDIIGKGFIGYLKNIFKLKNTCTLFIFWDPFSPNF